MNWVSVLLSSITAGVIAGGGIIVTLSTSTETISNMQWTIAVTTALIAAGKDARTYIAEPPKNAATPTDTHN